MKPESRLNPEFIAAAVGVYKVLLAMARADDRRITFPWILREVEHMDQMDLRMILAEMQEQGLIERHPTQPGVFFFKK